MADCSCGYLLYVRCCPAQPGGIVVCCQIANQRGDSIIAGEAGKQPFQKGRLPRTRTGNQAHNTRSLVAKLLTQGASKKIVLLHHLGPDLDHAGAHATTSSEATSISRPVTIVCPGVPHAGQLS